MLHFQLFPLFTRANCIALLTLLAFIFQNASAFADREIAWTEDFDAAVQRSAMTNSVLMIHFYTDNCPPCRLLEKKTFHDTTLVDTLNQNVIPVRINADKRRDLATKYNITRWPTDVYLFPNGDEIYRGVSDQDPTVYATKVKRIALRNRDWCVERNAMAQATQRRQDQAIAAKSPQIPSDASTYYGNAGHQVKTQSATWSTPSGQVNLTGAANQQGATKKVIDNPYITQRPPESSTTISQSAPTQLVSSPSSLYAQPSLPASPKLAPMQQAAAPVVQGPSHPNDPSPIAHSALTNNQSLSVTTPVAPMAVHSTPPPVHAHTVGTRNGETVSAPEYKNSPQTPPVAEHIIPETIGMSGYCPVTLLESIEQNKGTAWANGSPAYAVRHRGRVYYCASEKARQVLLSNPDRYTPGLSGYDLVHFFKTGKLLDGSCKFGCIQPNTSRIFLFANLENYQEFEREIDRYAKMLEQMTPERVATRASESPVR